MGENGGAAILHPLALMLSIKEDASRRHRLTTATSAGLSLARGTGAPRRKDLFRAFDGLYPPDSLAPLRVRKYSRQVL